jgi:hypothetical protein
MIAAGYDLPYVRPRSATNDPSVTFSIHAQVMRRANRQQLKAEIRELLGMDSEARATDQHAVR